MGIQDNAFDVADALKHKRDGTKEAFDEFCQWAWAMEEERDQLLQENHTLRSAIQIVERRPEDDKQGRTPTSGRSTG